MILFPFSLCCGTTTATQGPFGRQRVRKRRCRQLPALSLSHIMSKTNRDLKRTNCQDFARGRLTRWNKQVWYHGTVRIPKDVNRSKTLHLARSDKSKTTLNQRPDSSWMECFNCCCCCYLNKGLLLLQTNEIVRRNRPFSRCFRRRRPCMHSFIHSL